MFAVLHIADFSLYAVLRTEPGLVGRAAALFDGTNKKSLVCAMNSTARVAGVELGMTAPQAVARCPKLVIRTSRPEAEAEARAALLAIAFSVSPAIEDTASGICTIDAKGLAPTAREPAARRAIAELAELGLPATAGIARTPLLALYAARAATPHVRDLARARNRERSSELRAAPSETATKSPRTNSSVLFLAEADERNFLASLPLAAGEPTLELAHVLQRWGLRTLGNLTELPRDEIIRRFGAEGLAFWNRAMGGSSRPLHLVGPTQAFTAAMEFEEAIETLEPLLFILRRFLERLALELRAAQQVAAEIDLGLKLEDETCYERHFRLPEPTGEVEILFRALHTHLESLRTAAAITTVTLQITPTRPLVRQQGLFETGLRDPHGFAETLARLSALVGIDRVGAPQLEDSHRPDAVKLVPPPAVISPLVEPSLHPPLGLPLRRFRPPLPARLGENDGRMYLWSDSVRGEISARSAPYYNDGGWWETGKKWARIEWDVALAEGGLYRLIKTGGAWFLEGEYD